MFENYTKDQLESIELALHDRVTYLETSKDEIDAEIQTLEESIVEVERQIFAHEDVLPYRET